MAQSLGQHCRCCNTVASCTWKYTGGTCNTIARRSRAGCGWSCKCSLIHWLAFVQRRKLTPVADSVHHGVNHEIVRQDFAGAEGRRLYDMAMDAFVAFVHSSYSKFILYCVKQYINFYFSD